MVTQSKKGVTKGRTGYHRVRQGNRVTQRNTEEKRKKRVKQGNTG